MKITQRRKREPGEGLDWPLAGRAVISVSGLTAFGLKLAHLISGPVLAAWLTAAVLAPAPGFHTLPI